MIKKDKPIKKDKVKKPAKTIRQILIYAMIFITILQSIIFILVIIFGGVLGNVVNYSYDPFLETTELRKIALESKLNSSSGVLTNYNTTIKNELQKISAKYNQPVSALLADANAKNELFAIVSDEIRAITAAEGITGSFIILDYDKDITTTGVDALYLRTSNNSSGNTLSLAVGNDAIASKLDIAKYSFWRNQLSFVEMDTNDFYTEPLRLGEEYKNIPTENLGYWSMPYDINYSGQDCIAYTIPLRDSVGITYGVIGVELNLSYLKSCLPYFELNSKGQGSYVLGATDSADNLEMLKIASSGESFDKINQFKETYEFSDKTKGKDVYTIVPKANTLGRVYSSKDVLEINTDAKYPKKVWVLSGVVEGKYLLGFVYGLRLNIVLAFAVTAILNIAGVFLVARLLAKPVNKFVDEVENIRPDNPVAPKPTIIREFNDLGGSIEKLTKDLSDFSAKASLIINMAGVPVGAFEYDKNSNVVFCTDIALELLKIDNADKKLFVSRREFEDKISVFMKLVLPNVDQVYKFGDNDEARWIHIKTAVNNGKILGTLRDVTAEKVAELQRIYERDHDAVTDLYNRDAFNERVKYRLINKRMATYAMIVMNIDDITHINKEYGSTVGDLVIKTVGGVLSKLENRNSVIARTTGDEFCIFLVARNQTDVEKFVDKMMSDFKECSVKTKNDNIDVSVSVGVALCPKDCEDFETLVQYGEFAMNCVKRANKNDVAYFSREEYEKYQAAEEDNKDIEEMIKSGNIRYVYQPIVDTSSGEIYGYEALMRPEKNNVKPDAVLEYAINNGLNYDIERITWMNSLEGYARQVSCLSPKKLFINSIPSQLLNDEDFNEIETKYKDHLDNIVMEVVENEQIETHIIDKKREIKEKWNCLIALDDYGSGYSNDNTLLSVKPDLIKLDIELVTDIETDSDRQSLVKNIVSYAHNRDIKVLAEGIESREQMYTLISIGVDLLQGFYLAKPDILTVKEIDPTIKFEIVNFDPQDMFVANVGLSM